MKLRHLAIALLLGLVCQGPPSATAMTAMPPPIDPARRALYDAHRPKSVLDLQLFAAEHRMAASDATGPVRAARLVRINPYVDDWMVLELTWASGREATYHLENHHPGRVVAALAPTGLRLEVDGSGRDCPLWTTTPSALESARQSGSPYAPLCDGLLSLRNPTVGRKTTMEWTTDFLRDNVWQGERITTLVRDSLYKDSELRTSELEDRVAAAPRQTGRSPSPARVDPAVAGRRLVPREMGLPLDGASDGKMVVGSWYPVTGLDGVFVSTMEARYVDPAISERQRNQVADLDEKEQRALAYQVAFDLDRYELGFEVGTDHPRVDWSSRVKPEVRDSALPGPDGFDTIDPLVRTGKVAPADVARVVATFTGGFKRTHGAFKSAELGLRNEGSHYGFVEHGAVLGRLQPGLSTLVVWRDGSVDLRTWEPEDDWWLGWVRHARQNGVPILEPDPATGEVRPGLLITKWGDGNWSGSVEGKLRTVRAAVCLQDGPTGEYLLYGFFSSATPSAMARILAAYDCRYAMLTDMNALEHTYLAVHRASGGAWEVDHLIEGMDVLDKEQGGRVAPRFVGFADNRDFFTVLRRQEAAP